MERRVVITGLGTVNPLGNSVEEYWKNIQNVENGIAKITRLDVSEYPVSIGGILKDYDPKKRLEKKNKIQLIHADAENLPIRSIIFHKAYAITLIQNLVYVEKTIIEIRRVCRDHAKIVVTALKKKINPKNFLNLIKNSNLKNIILIDCKKLKDFIAIANS